MFYRLTFLLISIFLLGSCDRPNPAAQGRVVVNYWERWTGFEADAMRAIVDDFNASQPRIFVDYSSVSQMDRKLMLAIAGEYRRMSPGSTAGRFLFTPKITR